MELAQAITETKSRIKALEAELQRLYAELAEARKALKSEPAKRRTRIRKTSKLQSSVAQGEPPYKPGSSVAWAVEVLQEAKTPLNIDVLIERIRARGHEVIKSTLVGNLSRYVKEGLVFTREARSQYGLLEWQQPNIDEIFEQLRGSTKK